MAATSGAIGWKRMPGSLRRTVGTSPVKPAEPSTTDNEPWQPIPTPASNQIREIYMPRVGTIAFGMQGQDVRHIPWWVL